jgi:Domain of unknown function (DUF4189)
MHPESEFEHEALPAGLVPSRQSMIWPRAAFRQKNRRRASMRLVPLTAVALLAFAAAALPTRPAAAYGAIAWDKATGRYGWSKDQTTAEKAAELAISGCGATGCKVVIRMTSATPCGALATTQDGKTAGGAARKDVAGARLAALANCKKANKGECIIRIGECGK